MGLITRAQCFVMSYICILHGSFHYTIWSIFLIYWYRKSYPSGLKFHYFISNIEHIGIKTNAIFPVSIAWPVRFSIWSHFSVAVLLSLFIRYTHTVQDIGIWIFKRFTFLHNTIIDFVNCWKCCAINGTHYSVEIFLRVEKTCT